MNINDWDKAAENYFEAVDVSPFSKGVVNPLFDFLKNLYKNKKVIDFGCGIGNLVPYVKNFKYVLGVDYSHEMISRALDRCNYENVSFQVADMTDLRKFYGKFDVGIAVNSIISPSLKDLNKIFSEVFKVIRKEGVFLGIFPSMNSEIYRWVLTVNDELKKNITEKEAIINARKEMQSEDYDYLAGIYDCDGERQKHFFKSEIEYYLNKSGFKEIEFGKVLYPWSTWDARDELKNKNRLWDWFVSARK